MNGRVAKKLRKQAYGDDSIKVKKYGNTITKKDIVIIDKSHPEGKRQTTVNKITVVCTDNRVQYKELKKEYYKSKGE